MKERPILFSGPMVRAILDGKKTQTRRVVKNAHGTFWDHAGYQPRLNLLTRKFDWIHTDGDKNQYGPDIRSPFGLPGDRLWVRETWGVFNNERTLAFIGKVKSKSDVDLPCSVAYRADQENLPDGAWRPSIHMPRWASRIVLEVTGVRVERLQDIGEEDAMAEGIREFTKDGQLKKYAHDDELYPWRSMARTPRDAFQRLWFETYGEADNCWGDNPWVWVVEFRRLK
jgi:hypothetical protein